MDPIAFIFIIAILMISVIVHEISHGYVAEYLGDPTARLAGRLTLNPIPHLDLVGSFIVPVISFFLAGAVFGWAKPVPYNPYNLKNPRYGGAFVALAGPLSNILIAIFFGMLIRLSSFLGIPETVVTLSSFVVFINIILAFLNLLPVPPLDGSKILFALLPYHLHHVEEFLERYGIFIVIFIIFFLWRFLLPAPYFLFRILTGTGFF